MRLEYQGESRWNSLGGSSLTNFVQATGALVGPGLPDVQWQPLPFYTFTALVRLPDAVGGSSEWYLTNGGKFWSLDRFGVAISAMNEVADLQLTRQNVTAYFRFWCAFTHAPKRYIVLDVKDPELAAEAHGETDPMLKGVMVEGYGPQGWLLSATVLCAGEVQRRYFRISAQGDVGALEGIMAMLPALMNRDRKVS